MLKIQLVQQKKKSNILSVDPNDKTLNYSMTNRTDNKILESDSVTLFHLFGGLSVSNGFNFVLYLRKATVWLQTSLFDI